VTKPSLIPVCANTTGWPVIGYACNEQQARRVVKKSIGDHSKSLIDRYDFKLNVWERTPLSIELNGGPKCWTWAVGKTVNHGK
jgi:hypothetical protein